MSECMCIISLAGLDPTEKARIGATLIRCRVLAAKIATAWRGCNNGPVLQNTALEHACYGRKCRWRAGFRAL